MPFISGSKIGPYEIISSIGHGGMGEVYLAQDDRLNRKVALKILKETSWSDEQKRSRFIKEAKSASSLNNPNIVTVYDIITQDHVDVIVMEYMEGESLRTILSRGKMQMSRALLVAADVASALAAAHNAGIIHRDIKPENIMITKTNVVKVLDFGLAKLMTKDGDGEGSQITTASQVLTKSGTIMGTIAYMSPEQAEGLTLDSRTDIFSLGVVLFEMLCGMRPFQGNSTIDTLHAIMRQEPIKPNVDLPHEVIGILDQVLSKNREERYQHAGDLALDLRKIKTAIETNSLPSQKQFSSRAATAKYLYAAIVGLTALLGLTYWKLNHTAVQQRSDDVRSYENSTLTPLTVDDGYELSPTFSPDGETIAYVSDRTGNFEIFLKQISGGPDINLTNNSADDIQPAFSPDGKQIAFVSSRSSVSVIHYPIITPIMIGGDIWVMPALGGTPKRIAANANFPSWSPDGSRILFSTNLYGRRSLYTVPAGGGNPTEIPIHYSGSLSNTLRSPVYSPSGRWILFAGDDVIYTLNTKNGDTKLLTRGMGPAWLGSDRIVYSNADPGKNYSLYVVSFSDEKGELQDRPHPVTIGRGRDLFASPSRNGSYIAFAAVDFSSNLEVMPFDADGRGASGDSRPITHGNDIISFSNFSPDGRTVAFASQRGASSHIWQTDLNSQVQLTSDPKYFDGFPRYSPDGKKIAFTRRLTDDPKSAPELWIMESDGANPRPVGKSAVSAMEAWTPSGDALLYVNPKDFNLYSFDFASHNAKQMTTEGRLMPVINVSSDGRWILYQSMLSGNVDVRALPVTGGASRSIVATPHNDYHPFVSPSGNWLYVEFDHKNIYRVPGPSRNWLSKEPEKVTNFPESGLSLEDPQISRDGKQLLYSRTKISGDIWILKFSK